MKVKIFTALLALVFCLSLVSCDAVVNIMGRMGGNILGTDTKQVEAAVESVKVSEENETKKNGVTAGEDGKKTIGGTAVESGSTFTYKDGDDDVELYSVGKTDDGKTVIGIGSSGAVTLPKTTDETKKALEEIETVLPPQDISLITSALEGSGKAETLEKLSKPIEDEATKKAAEGTKTVIVALLENAKFDASEDADEKTKKASEVINTILDNLTKKDEETGETKDLTMGDLVVLQTITNVISDSSSSVLEVFSGGSDTSKAVEDVLDKANDSIVGTASILNTVSGTTTMFDGVDLEKLIGMVM